MQQSERRDFVGQPESGCNRRSAVTEPAGIAKSYQALLRCLRGVAENERVAKVAS